MRIVHLSDLHFGHHDAELAEGLADDVATQIPTIVVVSGDFTQRGTRAEFEQAQRFLQSLQVPTFSVPGNHDIPERDILARFFHPYALYKQYIGLELEPFIEVDGVAIAGLKTSRRARWGLDWSHGTIGKAQLNRLASAFRNASPNATRVVVAHHPLLEPERQVQLPVRRVRSSAAALRLFEEIGVRVVLSGHFHLSYVRHFNLGQNSGLPAESTHPSILLVQASSTISTRLRGEPNAYNIIDIGEGAIVVVVRERKAGRWVTRQEVSARG
jgi:3',5'-cyclic AMP phosphodiesterase CpdA